MNQPADSGPPPPGLRAPEGIPPGSRGLVAMLTSMRFALGLVSAITVACVVATVLPQGSEVAEHVPNNPEAARWLKRLAAAGLTNVFSSWWFIAMLTALGASLAACIGRRIKILRTGSGLPRREHTRMLGTLLVHAGLLLTLVGGAIRIFFSEQGVIQFREGEQATFFVTEDQQHEPLPFALQLVKFEIERYAPPQAGHGAEGAGPAEALSVQVPGEAGGTDWPVTLDVERDVITKTPPAGTNRVFRVAVLRRVPDFVMDATTKVVRTRSEEMLNPALLVRVTEGEVASERWLFARFPDFDMSAKPGQESLPLPFSMNYLVTLSEPTKQQVKSFKSTLRVLQGDRVAREQMIEVNAPMNYGGYAFYQSGYNEDDPSWTALRVVRDPSVPVVYLGFILMGIGAFLTAYCRAEKVKEESQC